MSSATPRTTPRVKKANGEAKSSSSSKTATTPRPSHRLSTTPRSSVASQPTPATSKTGPSHYSAYRVSSVSTSNSASLTTIGTTAESHQGLAASPEEKELYANPIYQLHHQALHRYLELGWQVHWGYVDMAPLTRPASSTTPRASATSAETGEAAAPNGTEGSALPESTEGGNGRPSTPPPPTMTPRRASTSGGSQGGSRSTSRGCLTALSQCPFCAEDQLLRKPLDGAHGRATRAALISSQSLPARVLSLRRWVETFQYSKEKEALQACLPHLSHEAMGYMAAVGLRTGWAALKMYAELPALSSQAQRNPHSSRTASPATSFFTIPPLSELRSVTPLEMKELLALPRFCPHDLGDTRNTTAATTSLARSLDRSGVKLFYWQRRLELSKRRLDAAAGSVLLLGDMVACDVFLVVIPQPQRAGNTPPTHTLSVWGRARHHNKSASRRASSVSEQAASATPPLPAPVNEVKATSDELFFIAHSIEDYWRLAAAFGWVYGWQLAYSTRGPPLRSLPWLRFFNESALDAAMELHG